MKKLFTITILTLVLCCFFLMCDRNKIGDSVVIRTECLGCNDEEMFDSATKYATDNNAIMFGVVAGSDSSIQLFEGQLGTITQVKKDKIQIELSTGRKVWVLERHVKKTRK